MLLLLFPVFEEDAVLCTSEVVLLSLEEVLFSKEALLLSPVELALSPEQIVLSPGAGVMLLCPNCDLLEVPGENVAPLLSPAVSTSMISSTVALLDGCGESIKILIALSEEDEVEEDLL